MFDLPGSSSSEHINPLLNVTANILQPCQSLFVAPCAHAWHYKCIRPLLEGKNSTYPQFLCPNCRAYTDLTADVDVAESDVDESMQTGDNGDKTDHLSTSEEPAAPVAAPEANPASPEVRSVNSIDMPNRPNDVEMGNNLEEQRTRTETPDAAEQIIAEEGPLTPRNNAGPFVFDGSAGRGSGRVVAIPELPEERS